MSPTSTSERRGRGAVARGWGWVMADGVLGVLVGIAALFLPGLTVLTLALLLGVALVLQGVAQAVAAAGAASGAPGRGWAVALAVLSVVAGIICVIAPGVGLFTIVVGITVWFFAAGVNELVAAVASPRGRLFNVVAGVVTLVAAVIVLFSPGVALGTAAVLAGVLFLVRGVAEIVLATRLRRL